MTIKNLLQSDFRLSENLSDKEKVSLYSELRVLLKAGLDVKTTIELMIKGSKGKIHEVLVVADEALIKGRTLSEAFKALKGFSNYEVYSIRIGEETGNLLVIVSQLEQFFHRKLVLRRQLIGALSYPAFVMSVAIAVVYFMLNHIVPMFADIFKRFGGELPALTKTLLSVSEITRNYFPMFFLTLVGIIIFLYVNRNTAKQRQIVSSILLKIPVLGVSLRKIYLARFCQAMHLLTSARVPLTDSIAMVENMIGFYPLEISMPVIRKYLINGVSLNDALNKFPIYEEKMVALVRVAEEVNQLDNMFEQIALQYNEDIEHQSKVLSSVIEPLMIVFIASVVGLILVAMYLPLFKLSTTIG